MPKSMRLFAAAMLLSFSSSLVAQVAQDSNALDGAHPKSLSALAAQPVVPTGSLTTLFAGGNGQNGNMFDVQAVNKLTITSFAIHLSTAFPSTPMEVYYKLGTSAGFETNAAAWTLLGTAVVTSLGEGVSTPLPIGGLTLEAGQLYGLYVTSSSPIGNDVIHYSNGSTDYSNSDLTIFHGYGKSYPFGGTYSPRIWNGTIFYDLVPAYDTSFLDDAGNSLICFNSITGDFQWNVLTGPNAGNTYTGRSVVTNNRVNTSLITPFGVAPYLRLTLNRNSHSASASLTPTLPSSVLDPTFTLSDSNTENNPPSPCLPIFTAAPKN